MLQIVLGAVFAYILVYLYKSYSYSYWRRRGIAQIEPSFPFGNTRALFTNHKSQGDVFADIYWHFKRLHCSVGGFYMGLRPNLMIIDPQIIKNIMVKDFQNFNSRAVFYDEKTDPLTAHMFNLAGPKWKHIRVKLTPTFTSGKMKMMFNTLLEVSNGMKSILEESTRKSEPLDIKDLLNSYTLDVIASCAFGIETNCLKNPENDFRKYCQYTFEPDSVDQARRLASQVVPGLMRFFRVRALNKNVTDFYYNVVKETVQYREQNDVFRKDFLQMLIQLKNQGRVMDDDCRMESAKNNAEGLADQSLTMNEVAAQCFIFFLAGFETSSTTMTFCLYELSVNEDIQEKLRMEVLTVLKKHGGELSYAAIAEMKYMDQVIDETLRKYPPIPFLARECTMDYQIPNTNYVMKKGGIVRMSLQAMQMDPEYYPDPDRFDPERFSEERKKGHVPYTYMPFGEGPRICIGLRFGVMQTKVGLAQLLKDYRFTLNDRTATPLVMEPKSFTMSTKGGVWLDARALTFQSN